MASNKMKSTRIIKIPSPKVAGRSLGATNSMVIVGNDIYVLKSCGGSRDGVLYQMAIVKIINFAKSPTISVIQITKDNKVAKKARHSNAITYADKNLYIATMNNPDEPQLLKVSKKGVIKGEYKYRKGNSYGKIHNCTYFGKIDGKLTFIVGLGRDNGKAIFEFAQIQGNELVYLGKTFYSHRFPTNYISNSTFYDVDKKKFYITLFVHNEKDEIKTSFIYSYKIGSMSDVQNGQYLSVANESICPAPSKYNKYEIEGLGIVGSTKYVVANCNSNTLKDVSDALFVLKKDK